ncbi:MAG: ArdC-like ssDNA-binding domain-containing protein [Muribaculaceae bacterium]|nr:ArdC-like ssDNA-binding domain-containing protein [Muribaculaceae bacterium]
MTNNFKPNRSRPESQPRLSTEEWIEKKQAEKEAVYAMIDETAAEVVSAPEKFRDFLDTQSRMDRYSAANALLIYKQRPDSTQLKSFGDWGEDNVRVNKGEKSFSILEPVEYTKKDGSPGVAYNVKKVFDVAQTNGKRQPAPTANRDPSKLVAVMLDTAPVKFESVDELPFPNMGAFYNNEKQTLFVKRDIGDSVALCQCVAQELGHAQLAIDSEAYSRNEAGFKAVCIGYMLCKKFGVDTKNFAINRVPEELSGADVKDIRAELGKTRTAMSEIYSRISDELYRQKQERSKDMER